jgi:hypothetical protein
MKGESNYYQLLKRMKIAKILIFRNGKREIKNNKMEKDLFPVLENKVENKLEESVYTTRASIW